MAKRIKAKELVAGTWYYDIMVREHYYIVSVNKNNTIDLRWENPYPDERISVTRIDDMLDDAYLAPVYNFKQQLKEWVKQ